jgi:membrane protease YdiL (CAAX protease family)
VLTDKPWRAEAIARLLAAQFVCAFLGSLVLTVIRFDPANAQSSPAAFYLETGGAALALLGALAAIAKPWRFEQFKLRAAVFLACCYGGLALTGIAQKSSGASGHEATVLGMIVAMLSFQGAALPLIWIFTRQHGATLREGFDLGNGPGHAMMLGATAALCFIPVGLGLQLGIAMLAKQIFHIDLAAQEAVAILRLVNSWPDRVMLGMFTIVIAPLAEEGLFRGIFYPAIKRLGYPGGALWVTSLVFALIHFNVLSFIPLAVLAVVLVKLYERTGNLLACIACHASFNAVNFAMLFVMKDSVIKPGS